MKKSKKVLAIAALSTVALTLAACGSNNNSGGNSGGSDGDVPTLTMYRQGDAPINYDDLIGKANEILEEKVGAHLKMEFVGWGDWDQKMSTIVASGEAYDISIAQNYVTNAQKGAYTDLTDMLPDLAKTAYENLPESYITGNLIGDKLYAFPINGNVYGQQMMTFNQELIEKYGLDISNVGDSYASATDVLTKFHEQEPNTPAFAIGKDFKASGNYDYPLGNGYPFAVKSEGTGTPTIINQYDDDEFVANLVTLHEWYTAGLIPTDAATSSQPYNLNENTWFMREETQGPLDYGDNALTNAAGKELVSQPLTKPFKSTGQAQMANYVVGNTSKNKELAVKLLGELNSNPELLNLLVYGIEGEQWEKVDDDTIKLLDGYQADTHLGAWNTGDNTILYTTENITDEMISERDESIENSVESPILGFNFNTDSVKTEITNIANVMNRYVSTINTGTLDPKDTLPELLAGLEQAGWAKVQEEMQTQLDEFYANK
ncbi:ABC transporter substrate-binding protein [Enterococcus timonensis]|uniref:ABC transporter substrate-binding protein n=1 Tax=Enterococcus timonensis TaxID=1852364 RepID=UPI0008DAB9DD|nr:ABC transporter substrate-binding protein [Enterococcus timonensis]